MAKYKILKGPKCMHLLCASKGSPSHAASLSYVFQSGLQLLGLILCAKPEGIYKWIGHKSKRPEWLHQSTLHS